MSSSTLAGERKWGTARRGGMTVLGKVAVPKPLNLPSQKLENHGLDPNVEIVPRGTLSWGSRPSASNPWISSSPPNADCGSGSPSHLSGRPSSAGTRPSSSGSDKTHETVANAWNSSSRPTSSSGTLSSDHMFSSSLRPKSADKRPTSSHLSRFAEPIPQSSSAWGPSTTAERLINNEGMEIEEALLLHLSYGLNNVQGVKSSKEGFSLSSGDFPNLGFEKDNLTKNIESEDQFCSSSASGRIAQAQEDTTLQTDVKVETMNTWKGDGSPSAEDSRHRELDKRQQDAQHYINANSSPQPFDAWRSPPMNGPPGVWYGGRPQGPAFGALNNNPGGFPIKELPYYHPQFGPPPLAGGSGPVPPGSGSRGPPQSGDLCRAQMPDVYARPNMQFRHGFYPGPPGPGTFEGYFRPPMGYYNNEREIPYMVMGMGMAAPRPFYNGYPSPAADSGNAHGRSAEHVPSVKLLSEQLEPDYSRHNQAPRRVRVKNDNECKQREADENQSCNSQLKVLNPGKVRHPVIFSRNNERGAEEDTEATTFAKRTAPDEHSSHGHKYAGNSADSGKMKMLECLPNAKVNRSERVASVFTDMPQLPSASEKDQPFSAGVKDLALIHKIDGLNAKFRTSDSRCDTSGASNQEEEGNGLPLSNPKPNTDNVEPCNNTELAERNQLLRDTASVTHSPKVLVGHRPTKPMAVLSRKSYHGGQGRADQRGNEKIINIPNADECQRKHFYTDSASAVMVQKIEFVPGIHAHSPNVREVGWNTVINPAGNGEGASIETDDLTDIQSQRAKMRELAKQRAMQLQKEEEETTREQKAKALSKLEDLNRRALTSDSACQKAETKQATRDTDTERELFYTLGESLVDDAKFPESGVDPIPNCNATTLHRTFNENQADQPVELLRNCPLEVHQSGSSESVVFPLEILDDGYDGCLKQGASQFSDGGTSRYQRKRHNQMESIPLQKALNEKPVSVVSDTEKDNDYVATANVSSQEVTWSETKLIESCISKTSNAAVLTSTHQRRKGNRHSKNKHKLDEPRHASALPGASPPSDTGKESIENIGCKNSFSNLGNPVSNVTEPDEGVQPHEAGSSLLSEETNWNASNHWKPQSSRRLPRSQPTNRFVDKLHGSDNVIWAPVRTQNKATDTVEASQKLIEDSDISTKGDAVAQNAPKGKRAEMERYVPKPVALELAQQGSISLLSSINSFRSNEVARKEQSGPASSPSPPPITSASVYVGSGVDTNEGDSRPTKHKKDHGTWRQRGSVETSHPKVSTYDPTKDVPQSKEPLQSVKNDINPSSAEIKISSTVTSADHHNIPSNTTATLSKNTSFKHQSAVNRGKRHLPRGEKSIGDHFDSDSTRNEIDENNSHSLFPTESDLTDRATSSKENRSFGERMSSHWQPKSHTDPANDHHGTRSIGGESFTTEVNMYPSKDHKQHKVQAELRHVKESNSISQPLPSQSVNVKKDLAESIAGQVHEFDQEKQAASSQKTVDPIESAPTSRDYQLERNIQSESRRNAKQNSHSFRSHQPRAEWSSGHDNRLHSANTLRERQRQNTHYEYQPVGPYKGNKTEKVEEPIDGPVVKVEQKHWDRGHNHTKRGGNYYRRPNGHSN